MTEELLRESTLLKPEAPYGPITLSHATTCLDSEFEIICHSPCDKLQSISVVLSNLYGIRQVPIQLKHGFFKESLIAYLDYDFTFNSVGLKVVGKTLDLTIIVWVGPQPGFH